ncbi:MAG TPA: DUF2142 domain-containing protein [Aldersonia sp.]
MSTEVVTREDEQQTAEPRLIQRWGAASAAFTAVALIFGFVFAWITPPFWAHDEITQFGRAYQVAHGGLLPQEIDDDRGVSYGGRIPASIDELMGYALRDYNNNPPEPDPMVQDPGGYDRLESAPVSDAQRTMWFTNTASYSPLPYLPAALGIRIAESVGLDVGAVSLAARLAGLAVYLAIVGFGLQALRAWRIQWLAFTVAVLPIAVFQAGTVTADTLTNALAIVVSALLVKALFLGSPLNRIETAALLTSAVALPLCKPSYVLVAMLVVLVPPAALGFGGALRRWLPWAFAAIGALAFLAWTRIAAPTTEGMGLMRRQEQWHSVIPADQLAGMVRDPIGFVSTFGQSIARRDQEWFTEFFGELGFSYVTVPALSIIASLLALVVSVGIAERLVSSHLRTALVAVAVAASVALIYVALYLSFTPVGYFIIDGVQGRYFVPLAVLAFAVLLRWMPLRFTRADGTLPPRAPAVTIVTATVIGLIAAAVKYYAFVWG